MENIIQIILKDINKLNEKQKITENELIKIIEKLIKKIKKITIILSTAIILNSIGIIILNLWR